MSSPKKIPTLLLIAISAMMGLSAHAKSADELLAEADGYDAKFQAAEALPLYLEAEKLDQKNVEILLRIARQYRHLMADATSTDEKHRLGNLALAYSQLASKLAPKDSEAQLSVAITLGKMLPLESSKGRIESSKRIKAAADRALRLDSENDIAWHLLGRWNEGYADLSSVRRGVGEALYGKLPKSTYEDAARCFEKAVHSNPKKLMHSIALGIVLAKMGKNEEARKWLEKGLNMPNTGKDDPDYKQRGREALEKLP